MKLKIYFISILLPVIVGVVVGLITSPSIMYSYLVKPTLSPPNYLFPILWTILYILMGFSYGRLKVLGINDDKIDTIYYMQLFVNAMLSFFFFTFDWKLFSFIWILLLDILVFIMIYCFYKKNKLAGLLQIPYLIWIIFASYLNFATYLLN